MPTEILSFNYKNKNYQVELIGSNIICDRCKKIVDSVIVKNKENRELLHIEVECHGGVEYIQIPYKELKNITRIDPGIAFKKHQ